MRRPRSVYDAGDEPDPRFSLANERTFLAWIRTSLALVAAGLALEVFVGGGTGVKVLASALIAVGAVLAFTSWRHWALAERALRTRSPLPAPSAWLLSGTIGIAGIAAFVVAILSP